MPSVLLTMKIEKILSASVPDASHRRNLTKEILSAVAGFMLETLAIDQMSAGYKAHGERIRVRLNDPDDGFYVRRNAYRKEYRRNEPHNLRVKSRSEADYTVLDFLDEEWGDLIRSKKLTPGKLRLADVVLYDAIRTYIQGLRRGTFGRVKQPRVTFKGILSTSHPTIRKNPPWLR